LKKRIIAGVLALGTMGIYYYTKDSSNGQLKFEEAIKKKKVQTKLDIEKKAIARSKLKDFKYKEYNPIDVKNTIDQSNSIRSIMEIYSDESLDISSKIMIIKNYQNKVLDWNVKSNKEPKKIISMRPEMALTLSIVLEEPLENILNENFVLELPLQDIYIVKTFSESSDFRILLSQNRLNKDNITLLRLREVYSNASETVFDPKSGKTLGEPSEEPSIPAPEDEDNDN
jgi:hypothetical protein